MKKIIVIIPVYNCEKYIERCLDSIFSQTYKNIDIICVNDGSTDRSLDILNLHKNIITISQNNKGVSCARNAALDYVFQHYDDDFYLSFVDSDDFIDSNYFEHLVQLLEKNDVDISCCSFKFETNTISKEYKQIVGHKKFSSFEAMLELLKDNTIQSHSPCKLYRSYVWKEVRYPEGIAWMEDQATIFKTFYNAEKGVIADNYSGYHYWQEGYSACRSEISNKRVLSSLFGYKIPCCFEFGKFSKSEQVLLKKAAYNAFASAYLSLLPKVNKKRMSIEEKREFLEYKKFVKTNKIVRNYSPFSKKEKYKKIVYIYLKPFYKILYKLFS